MGQSIMEPRKRGRRRSMRFRSFFWLVRIEAAFQVLTWRAPSRFRVNVSRRGFLNGRGRLIERAELVHGRMERDGA